MESTHLVTILLKIASSEPKMTPPMSMDLGSEELFIGRIAMGPHLYFLPWVEMSSIHTLMWWRTAPSSTPGPPGITGVEEICST